jgi:hypothetical protein
MFDLNVNNAMYAMFAIVQHNINHGFESSSGKTKDYKIDICCFSTKHAAIRSKSKCWLAWNQYNVFEWSNMSNCRLLVE